MSCSRKWCKIKTFNKSLALNRGHTFSLRSILYFIPEMPDCQEFSPPSSKRRHFHIAHYLQLLGFPAFSDAVKQIEYLLVIFHHNRNTCWFVKIHCSSTTLEKRGSETNTIILGPLICIILSTVTKCSYVKSEHHVLIIHELSTWCLRVDMRWFFLYCKCLKTN